MLVTCLKPRKCSINIPYCCNYYYLKIFLCFLVNIFSFNFVPTLILFSKDVPSSQIYQRIPVALFKGKKKHCLMISKNVHTV